jgi:glycosyltransferase involved in cell wall biosynthesis
LRSIIELASFSDGDIGFVIIGQGKEEAELKKFAMELNVLDNRLHFLPSVNKNQLSAVHSIFDMATSTVLPIEALYANSANKVFDAFAAGSPLLINHGGWLCDLIKTHKCGLVINNSPTNEDYKNVRTFLLNNDEYSFASRASLGLGKTEFNREYLYTKLKTILEKDDAL